MFYLIKRAERYARCFLRVPTATGFFFISSHIREPKSKWKSRFLDWRKLFLNCFLKKAWIKSLGTIWIEIRLLILNNWPERVWRWRQSNMARPLCTQSNMARSVFTHPSYNDAAFREAAKKVPPFFFLIFFGLKK